MRAVGARPPTPVPGKTKPGGLYHFRPAFAKSNPVIGWVSGQRRSHHTMTAGSGPARNDLRSRYEITWPIFVISLRLLMPFPKFLRSSYSLTTAQPFRSARSLVSTTREKVVAGWYATGAGPGDTGAMENLGAAPRAAVWSQRYAAVGASVPSGR